MTAPGRPCTVLDASALVEVLLRSAKGGWFRQHLNWTEAFHAPDLLIVEAAAVLRRYELREVITEKRAGEAFDLMATMPLSLVSTSDLVPEAWSLRHHITVSDACYVVLARRLGATLATDDRRLARTHHLGVPILVPSDDT